MTRWRLLGSPNVLKDPRMLYDVPEEAFRALEDVARPAGFRWIGNNYQVGLVFVGSARPHTPYIVWEKEKKEEEWQEGFARFEDAQRQLRWLLDSLIEVLERKERGEFGSLSGKKRRKKKKKVKPMTEEELYKMLRHAMYVPVKQKGGAIPSKKEKEKRRKGRRKKDWD
jgi:hypothetical protein